MVLAVSSVIHRNVLDTTPVSPDRVITLHDAIDLRKFSPSAAPAAVRAELGISPDTVVIGFVGRFSPGKGLEELLDAAAILHGMRHRFRVVVAGEASYGEEQYGRGIRERCSALGLDGVVTFAGFRQDIPAVMAGFDIFAFPSHAESFGVALIEAMAMGLPVVSTNCDGVLDIVVDGETGIFIRPRAAGELAAALERFLTNAPLRVAMGRAGRLRAEALFDREKQIDRLEELYRSLCGHSTTTAPTEG
jgi:glycosyltransferase involved in cell wall biosynthesis